MSAAPPAQGYGKGLTKIWVQLTTGGAPTSPTFHELFTDPMFFDCEIWPPF